MKFNLVSALTRIGIMKQKKVSEQQSSETDADCKTMDFMDDTLSCMVGGGVHANDAASLNSADMQTKESSASAIKGNQTISSACSSPYETDLLPLLNNLHGICDSVFGVMNRIYVAQRKMELRLAKLSDRQVELFRKLEDLEKAVDEHGKTVKKVDQLISDRVIAAAEDKDKYCAFVEGFANVMELVSQRMNVHKSTELRVELYGVTKELVNAKINIEKLPEYFEKLKKDDAAQIYCRQNHGCWNQSMDEICRAFVGLFGQSRNFDEMAQKYDGVHFGELLVFPKVGDKFDPGLMESKQVDEGDEGIYIVESLLRPGIKKSFCLQECSKAKVRVSSPE